jgi:hypothetical protein
VDGLRQPGAGLPQHGQRADDSYNGAVRQVTTEGFYSRHAAFSHFDPSVGGFVYTTAPDAGPLTRTLTAR